MNDQHGRLTNQELSEVEAHLRASLSLLTPDDPADGPASVMRESLELSLALLEELHRERDLRRSSAADPGVEVAALREFVEVLLRIAQISEGHWFQMAEDDRWFLDTQYKHRLMSKLGSALREFRSLMSEKGEVVKNTLVSLEAGGDASGGPVDD